MTSKKALRRAIRTELEYRWNDLAHAVRSAITPGAWTIGCENQEDRIRELTALVGPTPWEKVPISLMRDGTYQRLTAAMGHSGPRVTPDMARVAELERLTAGECYLLPGEGTIDLSPNRFPRALLKIHETNPSEGDKS